MITVEALTVQRPGGLQIRSTRTFSIELSEMVCQLDHKDPRVVLNAVQALYKLNDVRTLGRLRELLRHADEEVVHAAILAVGHLGDARVADDLGRFLNDSPHLQMAAVHALRELRSASSVSLLSRVLEDKMIGPMAAEAIACIGGAGAFRALARHWLRHRREIDTENYLALLRHVIEGITERPMKVPGFCEAVLQYLDDTSRDVRTSAACCLLASGPGKYDEKALPIVYEAFSGSSSPPACLGNRADLAPVLLKAGGFIQAWGFQIAGAAPKFVTVQTLADALDSCGSDCEYVCQIAGVLLKVKDPSIAGAVLGLYARLPWNKRPLLHDVLRAYKREIRASLIDCDTDDETRIVVSSITGSSPVCTSLEILDLPLDSRILVISQLSGQKSVMKCLPWLQWLERNPGFYITVAAEAAVRARLTGLLPLLRKALAQYPIARIINTVGELGDRESVPVLVSHLSSVSQQTAALIIDCLGRIGGIEAKKSLERIARSLATEESRLAFRALAACSSDEDSELFREASTNPDWHIRLLCVDFLGRCPSAGNFSVLTKLSVDPVPAVSQRAFYYLKYLPFSNFFPLESGEIRQGAADRGGIRRHGNIAIKRRQFECL